jgi:hypothetical protein
MAPAMRSLIRRAANRFAAPYVRELTDRIAELNGSVESLHRALADAQASAQGERENLAGALAARSEAEISELRRIQLILRHLDDEATANRRRLYELRASDNYELAFTEREPLVSFVLPTYTRFEALRDVALPSILGQTYTNVEAIVIGDCSPPETAEVIAEIGDPRVRYYNRTVRGPYPADENVRWYMLGSPPYNDALSMVRGRWIAAMADDDAVMPEFAETLLPAAQEHRYENCYGRHRVNYRGGEVLEIGSFPPQRGEFVTQATIYHAGLRSFQMSLGDPLFEEPNDWSLCRRMMDAGVRFGMVDAVVCDKYESRYESHSDWGVHGIPKVE